MQSARGKKVLITGASGGIGVELTRIALESNATVGGVYYSNASALPANGVGFFKYRCDVRNELEVDSLVNKFISDAHGLDAVIHLAGVARPCLLLKTPSEDINCQMATNFLSAVYLAKSALRHYLKQKFGCFAFTSSIAAVHPFQGGVIYAASKAALENLAEGIAKEYSRKNVTVAAFRLPPTRTKILSNVLDSLGDARDRLACPTQVAQIMWDEIWTCSNRGTVVHDVSQRDLRYLRYQ